MKQTQLWGNTKETHSRSAFSMDSLLGTFLYSSTSRHHESCRFGSHFARTWRTAGHHRTTIDCSSQPRGARQHQDSPRRQKPSKCGSFSGTWPASTPARPPLAAMRAAFPHIVLCFIPPHSTSYLQPCDVAVFRNFKSCIQAQASATLARSVIDGSFDGLAMKRHGGASLWPMGISCSHGLVRREQGVDNWMASLCAQAATPSSAMPSTRPLHSTPTVSCSPSTSSRSPLPKTPWTGPWQRRQDDEDDAPMPDAPPEPELIDMPPAPASAPRMSNLERCIALRLVYGAGPG